MIIKIENKQPTGQPFNLPKRFKNINSPSLAQMLKVGYAEFILPDEHNNSTHKTGKFISIRDAWTYEIVELSPMEISSALASDINKKYLEITTAYQAADQALFIGYTPEQQKTFYKQEEEATRWLADNTYSTPFIDGMVTVGYRSKDEIVARIIYKSELIKPVTGALVEKYQALLAQLAEIDTTAAYGTEKNKLDLIIW